MISHEFIDLAIELLGEDGVQIVVKRNSVSSIDPINGGPGAGLVEIGTPLGLLNSEVGYVGKDGSAIRQTVREFILDNSVQVELGDLLNISGDSVQYTATEITPVKPQGIAIIYIVKVD